MFEIGLQQSKSVPQLFFKKGGKVDLVVPNFLDDLRSTGSGDHEKIFFKIFDQKFKLGTVNKGPGTLVH